MSKINIEVSARHIHLSQNDLDKLFGRGYELKKYKQLLQPKEFAAKETVKIKGPKAEFPKVRVLGPTRKETQVEVSMTDAYALGIEAPIRLSGDLEGTPGIKVIGPKGQVKLKQGVIIAKRHIHASPFDLKKYGLKNNQKVRVAVNKGERGLTFCEVIVRVDKDYKWTCQVDTDEANAASIAGVTRGEVIL